METFGWFCDKKAVALLGTCHDVLVFDDGLQPLVEAR